MKDKIIAPRCPRCKTNVNVIDSVFHFRCVFCGTKIKKNGQTTLQ